MNSSFFDNFGIQGGSIVVNLGSLVIRKSTFSSNVAHLPGGGGGGAIKSYTAKVEITSSTFADNYTSSSGGAIYCSDGTQAKITNSTFLGNRADVKGGAIENDQGMVTLTNCTIAGNSSPEGAGGDNTGTISFLNTIIAGNTIGANCTNAGTLTDSGYNLEDDDSCGFSKDNHSLRNTNPLLAPLADYGGQTWTMALLPGSPAIDRIPKGVNSCGREVAEDQRGVKRPQWGERGCDLGAFESRGFVLLGRGGDHQETFINTAFPKPLDILIYSPFDEPVEGGRIAFAGPAQGASISPNDNHTLISGFEAALRVLANGQPGAYQVTVKARGVGSPVRFQLTNRPMR
jgi:predicted outer membrane repeat protein